jgi:signal transduction histidine kinase/CheY-like chemotaxis protein
MSSNLASGHGRHLGSSVSTLRELLYAMERTVIEQSSRLEEALQMAQHASRTKSEFLSAISYEIRTPMNAVMGMADLLAETELAPEQRQYLDIMVANGSTMMDLINSILDLARLESGRLQLENAQFDLTDLIDRTVSTFAVRAHRKGLELAARIAPGVPEYLVGDPLRLRQIVVNLVANAIKFTEAGSVVLEVEAVPRTSALIDVSFSVTDTGIGIAKEQLDSIYSSFANGNTTVSRKFGGSGIGLSIAKRLVDLMHGEISAESEVGKGSRFCFKAPFGLPCSALAPIPLAMPDLFGHRVLIVDHHSVNRLMARETLAYCRAEVNEASSAAEALLAIRNAVVMDKPYKLVLLDMRMPDAGGQELIKRISREQLPTASLIPMLYSDDIGQRVAQLREHHLDAYLVKPITRRGLFRAVSRKLAEGKGVSPHHRLGKAGEPAHLSSRRKMRILVADDSTDSRFLIDAYLRTEPCTLTFAMDGEEAVEKATTSDYDLILMDIQMPKKDGLAATRAIRKWESEHAKKPVPILALTASAFDEDIQQSLKAGCNAHINKPVKKRVILKAIHDIALQQPSLSATSMKEGVLRHG